MAAIAQQNVADALALCGVLADTANVIFDGSNGAERISSEVFNDSFHTCIDIKFNELEENWRTYSALTVVEGRIRLRPRTKVNIKAFVQWTRDMVRQNEDPAAIPFPVNERDELIERYNTHKQWVEDAPNMAKNSMPKNFTDKMEWTDWKSTLVNFLKSQPGRNGVPLNYVVRDNVAGVTRQNANFLDDYVDKTPITGRVFTTDASKVHSYIVRLISENSVAEQKILPYKDSSDGRVDFLALQEFYEGVGANAKAILAAERDLQELFYGGEKPPHMWWDRFEVRLTNAFAIIDKDAGRQVHTDEMKLRMLNSKVRADFLVAMKTNIEMQMNMQPMQMTYESALSNYRNTVNQRNPTPTNPTRTRRRIQSTGRGGQGRGGRSQGRGGRGGRNQPGRGRGPSNSRRDDEWQVTGLDGRQIKVHPAYRFEHDQWFNIPEDVRNQLSQMRRDYQSNQRRRLNGYNGNATQQPIQQQNRISQMYSAPPNTQMVPYQPLPPQMGTQMSIPPPPPAPIRTINQVGQYQQPDDLSVVTGGTLMGGRNEQASLRSRNPNRHIQNVITKRRIGKAKASPEPAPNTVAANEADTNADTCCLGTNFIPILYTNRTADVYPYSDAYEPIENIPIVSGATAYDHPNGNTYILVFHEALYYGTQMKHSLINPNQIRFSGLDFFDNPIRDEELYAEMSDNLVIPLTFKGTKCVFSSRVPTRFELDTCQHYEMTSQREWNPDSVNLRELRKVSQTSVVHRSVYQVTRDTQRTFPTGNSNHVHDVYAYTDPSSDEAILSEITPSLVQLKEMCIAQINTNEHDNESFPARRTFVSRKRHAELTADSLSELWHIGPKRAKATIEVTTQNGIRSAIMPLSRRYRSDRMYNLKRLRSRFATDTFFADMKSLHNNTCCQVFSHKVGFAACYPKPNAKGDSLGEALDDFVHDFGAPEHLTFDGHQSQVGRNTKFFKNLRKYNIDYHVSAPRRPNENPAEGAIREIKRRFYRVMVRKQVPQRLWDYLIIWLCETGNLSVSSSRYANGRTAVEYITGETPDISEYLDFGFYDWVTYRTNAGLGELSIGRWIGVSHKVGQLMSYWILTVSGRPISCVNVQRLTEAEQATDEYRKQIEQFDTLLGDRLDAKDKDLEVNEIPDWNRLSTDEHDPQFNDEFNKVINDDSVPEADEEQQSQKEKDETTQEIFDSYIDMEVGLPRGADNELYHAKVKRRAVDKSGVPMGVETSNPITDTRLYEVEFLDGTVETMAANVIAENILSQVDEEGHRQLMIDEIVDHRTNDDAVSTENAYYNMPNGTKRRRRTTKGWELCILWKDGSSNWVALKDMKNSYPIQVADYARSNKIQDQPAFAWWVPYVLKKRKAIIKKVKSKYWQRTHKFGIKIPKSVKEALDFDKENNNTLWRDSIKKEMPKIVNAVVEHEGDASDLVGYQQITGHMIFDVKMGENFRRKARFVADGHKTKTPSSVTYSTVVSRDSVRICLTIAALNDLEVLAADVENAFLTAPCREKVWMRGGPEFGNLEGKVLIIKQALYGLKSSGAAFRAFLAEKLDDIGFKSSVADPDVWMRPAAKPNGERYYEYILCYVDDLLCISHEAARPMKDIQSTLKFKDDKVEEPEFYLGAKLQKKDLNGRKVWTMSSTDYIKSAVENVEEQLKKKGDRLPTRAVTPMSQGYQPETDSSAELDADGITTFQELIGILRWAVEIGRVDILTEISMLSTYQASPREGHLEQIHHIFAFLKKKPKLTLYFDPQEPNIDPAWFHGDTVEAFKDQYRDAKEELPPTQLSPEPLGSPVTTTAYVDASHAANKVTRRSHTGFIIFLNRAPIIWYSKRQNTVEASTFSSEFIAMKACVEYITALRFKLRMFGVPVLEPTKVLCDNESVVKNSSILASTLNKKHSSIAYHSVRWNVAAHVIQVAWINTHLNLADAMTKRLTADKREKLFGDWTY